MVEKISGILFLREEQTTLGTLNRDAEEVLQGTKVTHGKLRRKMADDLL
jgi:hypothetical protein